MPVTEGDLQFMGASLHGKLWVSRTAGVWRTEGVPGVTGLEQAGPWMSDC